MINYNGSFYNSDLEVLHQNRAFLYGDAVFETLKIVNNKIFFWEDHYFRLMASMRILRMEIPMNFTLDYIQNQILKTTLENENNDKARVRLTVFRNSGGLYSPKTNEISYIITSESVDFQNYFIVEKPYTVDIYKDFYLSKHLLSSLKTTNRLINITGSIYAHENNFDNCFLINEDKNIVEALQGNVFIVIENQLVTPPIADGCINGIMRKQILKLAQKMSFTAIVQRSISPFELQKADEIFVTNVIKGIQPISVYRKKTYSNEAAKALLKVLNAFINN